MRPLLFLAALATFALAFYSWVGMETQIGDISAKIHQTCAALAAEGVVTDQDRAWRSLTTGWPQVINPRLNFSMLVSLFATVVLIVAATKWPRTPPPHPARTDSGKGG
jgi:hypothetical protein